MLVLCPVSMYVMLSVRAAACLFSGHAWLDLAEVVHYRSLLDHLITHGSVTGAVHGYSLTWNTHTQYMCMHTPHRSVSVSTREKTESWPQCHFILFPLYAFAVSDGGVRVN